MPHGGSTQTRGREKVFSNSLRLHRLALYASISCGSVQRGLLESVMQIVSFDGHSIHASPVLQKSCECTIDFYLTFACEHDAHQYLPNRLIVSYVLLQHHESMYVSSDLATELEANQI